MKQKRRIPTPLLILLIVVALGVLCVLLLELTGTTHFFHGSKQAPAVSTKTGGGASVNNPKGESGTTSDTPTAPTDPGDTKSNTNTDSSTTLLAPSGNFVSNHRPNISGSPAPNTLSSVCTTTPGATCTITFTNGGTAKSLPEQTTDRAGSAYWNNWAVQDIGLTPGTWKIQAIAKLNSQTKSTADALDMVVAQ